MKATELMLGDWVMETNHGQIGKVTYLDANPDCSRIDIQREDGGGFPCSIDVIKPIPLTAEILKKNGWLQNGMTQEAIMECDGENCDDTWVSPILGGDLSVYFDCGVPHFNYVNKIEFLKINYVHELQHALRLCGLNDLADNFRIDRYERRNTFQ